MVRVYSLIFWSKEQNMKTRSIYKGKRYTYEKELKNLAQEHTLTTTTKEAIKGFHNHLSATGSGEYRICKLSGQLRLLFSTWNSLTGAKKELSAIEKADIERLVGWVNTRAGWAEATRSDYRRCIKQFFRWYEENDPRLSELPEIDITATPDEQKAQYVLRQQALKERNKAKEFYKYLAKFVNISYNPPQIDPSDILTDADIRQVITTGAKNSRDRALIGVLHESGMRAGEILNIRIRDLEYHDDRVLIHVEGKTGRRPVPIILNMAYLMRWLDDHPFKEARDSYLWLGLSSKNKGQPIFHSAATRVLDKAFERAGINKKHNLHWFRHSRASLYYGRLTEGELCDFFGWEKGSDMVKTYSHTKNDGAQAALNRIYNIQQEKEKEILLTCAACQLHNNSGSKFCARCGRPLTLETKQAKEDYMSLAFDMLNKVMADKTLREEFEKFCQEKE